MPDIGIMLGRMVHKLKTGFFAAFLSVLWGVCYASTTTPRMGLTVPAYGDQNWDVQLRQDASIIDSSACVLGSNQTLAGVNTFSAGLNMSGNSGLSFLSSNGLSSGILQNPSSNLSQLFIQAQDGASLNNSVQTCVDLAIYGGVGTLCPSNYGRFAVVGSSQNGSSAYSGFTATSPINASTLWSLPAQDGTLNQAFVTDGSAHLSFASVGVLGSALNTNQCVQTDGNGKLISSGGACGGGGGAGSSALQTQVNSVQVTSPTTSQNFVAGTGITLNGSASGSTATITITLTPNATNFIQNTSSLQSGATFYVSSGTAQSFFASTETINNLLKLPYTSSSQLLFNDSKNPGNVAGSNGLTWDNTNAILNVGGSETVTGQVAFGNATDTSLGNNPWVTIKTSGTAQALTITGNGNPSGGVQNQSGIFNIVAPLGASPEASIVIVDSVTDHQVGAGIVEIWSNNPLHNDPIFWIHRTSSNSSPEMRWDSPSPNMEMVNTSTDNAHGLGKWEPFAEASQGVDLQWNNRAWNNGTFETLGYLHPLSKLDAMPGLYLNAQNVTDDGGVITSSDTTGVSMFTLDAHTVGITAPQSSKFSYTLGLPILPKATGILLYNNGNRGGNFSVRQTTWTDTDFTYLPASGVKISTLTVTSITNQSCIGTDANGKLQAGTCSGGGGSSFVLAVGTGTSSGYTGPITSSQTSATNLLLDRNYFSATLQSGPTVFITPLSSTFTMYGANIPANAISAGSLGSSVIASSITLAAMYGAPTLAGTNFTSLPGTQVGSGVPAANIAAGSLGTSVISSSLAVNSVYPAAVSAGSYPNITGVGTLTAGVWNGTALTSTYLPTDTVYNDNASMATFSSSVTVQNSALLGNAAGATITISSNAVLSGATFYNNAQPVFNALNGAGLSSCNGATNGVTWSVGQFGCNTYSASTFGAVTSVSGTSPINSSGGATPAISLSGTIAQAETFTSSVTLNATIGINNGLSISTSPQQNASYTMVSTDTVILASAPLAGMTVTVLPAAQVVGRIVTIMKTDKSPGAVTIKAQAGEVISGTGTLTLNAYLQSATFQSIGYANGQGTWIPWGKGIQVTPMYVGVTPQGNTANTLNVSSTPSCAAWTTDVPVAVDSITIWVGVQNGSIDAGIYDNGSTGLPNNRIASVGITSVGAIGKQTFGLSALAQVPPGNYWLCLVSNSTTNSFYSSTTTNNQFEGFASCSQATGNWPLPTTLSGCGTTTRLVDLNIMGHTLGGIQ